jgi:antitoxin component of RelBE/YafQ-DinJ toxin-antitoxin module
VTQAFTVQAASASTLAIKCAQAACPTTGAFPLLSGYTGGAYVQDLVATGGVAPYTWTLASGALPLGLSLSGASIVGTPTSAGSAVTFTLKVTDSASNSATQQFSLTIVSASGAGAPARLGIFSQFVAGGAAGQNNDWDMTMFLQNTSATAAIPVRLIIHNDDGTTVLKATGTATAAPTPLTVTQQGDVQSNLLVTEIDRVLNPNTTLVVTCGLGQSVNVEGWVDVQAGPNDSNGFGINGFAVFRRGYVQGLTTGTAGFDSSGPNAAGLIPPIEGTVPLQTGLAASTIAMPFDATTANNFFNAVAIGTLSSSVGANIATATFYDQNGAQIGTTQAIAAPAGCTSLCHTAFELSPTTSAGAFTGTGTVVFTGTSLIGLGLRGSQYGTLTDVPVVAH